MWLWLCGLGWMLAGPDVVVVAPPSLQPALAPWIARRHKQGHRVVLLTPRATAEATRQAIRRAAAGGLLRAVVLIGDARGDAAVPTFVCRAPVAESFGGPPYIATDAPYGDLDGDGTVDTAVGRISVEDAAEFQGWWRKVQAFEKAGGSWRRRVEIVAGVGGFSRGLDHAIDQIASRLIAHLVPSAYEVHLTHADWRSPFCPNPATFARSTCRSMCRGCLFWVYMGHGHPFELDRVRVPDRTYPILTGAHLRHLTRPPAPPIAVLLACYTGAFYADESIGEKLLRHPNGPVAVVASSGVAMPYGMAVLGNGLAHAYFRSGAMTLGDAFFAARCGLEDRTSASRPRWLDWSAKLLSPNRGALEAERREHALLFQLLGDPLMRLPRAEEMRLSSSTTATAGGTLSVTIDPPFRGRLLVALVRSRLAQRRALPRRTRYDSSQDALRAFDEQHRRANDRVLRSVTVRVDSDVPVRHTLAVPREARGACEVIGYLEHEDGRLALGACPVVIREADATEPARPASLGR